MDKALAIFFRVKKIIIIIFNFLKTKIIHRSVLEITREWGEFEVNERKLTMKEVLKGASDGTLIEMFGTGTAAIVSPIGNIYFEGKMRPLPLPKSNVSLSNRYVFIIIL